MFGSYLHPVVCRRAHVTIVRTDTVSEASYIIRYPSIYIHIFILNTILHRYREEIDTTRYNMYNIYRISNDFLTLM